MTILSRLLPAVNASKNLHIVPAVIKCNNFPQKPLRRFSSEKDQSGLTKSQERAEVSTDVRPLGEKIKDATKTVSYTGVILVGVGVAGVIFYYVFRELFSSNSPNSIYSVALEKCKDVSNVLWILSVFSNRKSSYLSI